MDEIVKELKELKEDRKRDWEMITFLKERLLNAEKQGNFSEVVNKVDKLTSNVETILDKLNVQDEIERKIDNLTEELDKSQGYLGYFVESHEALKTKIEILSANFEANGHAMPYMDQKSNQLATEIEAEEKGNGYQIPLILKELKEKCQAIDKIVESQKLEFEDFKKELKENLVKTSINPKQSAENTLRCWNANCNFGFSKDIELRKDGVSILCPNVECRMINVVGKLNEGYKWMRMSCGSHFQQLSSNIKNGAKEKCQVCGKEGIITESMNIAIDPTNMKLNDRKKTPKEILQFLKHSVSLTYKCFNSNCNTNFPKNMAIHEDGVSVSCTNQKCRILNIVGKLKDQHRWMVMTCNDTLHFQQFPANQQIGAMAKCQICGTEGKTIGKNAITAVCV